MSRLALEGMELRISRSKTKYIGYDFRKREQMVNIARRIMTTRGNTVDMVESFKYLWSFLHKNGGFDKNVKHPFFKK